MWRESPINYVEAIATSSGTIYGPLTKIMQPG